MITRTTSTGKVLHLIAGEGKTQGVYQVLVECIKNGVRGLQSWKAVDQNEAVMLAESSGTYRALEIRRIK